jgi:hypothetical protein
MPSVTPPIHPCYTNGEQTTAVTPHIPHFTNGDLSLGGVGQQASIAGRPRTPPAVLEAREREEAYWNEVEDAASAAAEREFWRGTPENNPSPPEIEERPLNEVNQEWEDNVEVNPGWVDGVNQEWEDNVDNVNQEWNYEVDEAAYEGATAYSPTSYEQSSRYGNPSVNSFPAGQAAAEGRRQLQDELSIAEALEAAALDSAAQQSEERETRRRQWQYAVSRATDRKRK